MEIRSTLRRVTWPEKRLKEKEKGGRGGKKGENETNMRERERDQDSPVAKRFLTTFGTKKNWASSLDLHIFFFLFFLFQRCVAQTNGHHGSIPTRQPLVFPRWWSRKTFQRPRETQTTILGTCISTDYAHNFLRKFLNFLSTSRTNWRMV